MAIRNVNDYMSERKRWTWDYMANITNTLERLRITNRAGCWRLYYKNRKRFNKDPNE